MSAEKIDIGFGHFMEYFCWAPDYLPGNRENYGVPLPNVPKAGVLIYHTKTIAGGECMSAINFDLPELKFLGASHVWQVIKWEPLTTSPSILCMSHGCADHGYIREGRWVPA